GATNGTIGPQDASGFDMGSAGGGSGNASRAVILKAGAMNDESLSDKNSPVHGAISPYGNIASKDRAALTERLAGYKTPRRARESAAPIYNRQQNSLEDDVDRASKPDAGEGYGNIGGEISQLNKKVQLPALAPSAMS